MYLKVSNLQFYLIAFSSFLFFSSYYTITPILPLHIVNVGASNLELGLVMAIPSLLSIFLRIPFGIIADVIGHLRIMILSIFLYSFYLLLYSIAPNILLLYLGAILFAVPWSSFGPSAMIMASELSIGVKVGEAIGRYLTAIGAAMMVGPLLCSLLTSYFDYSTIFKIVALLPLSGLMLLIVSYFRGLLKIGKSEDQMRLELNLSFLSSMKKLLNIKIIVSVCLVTVLETIPMAAFDAIFSVYAIEILLLTPVFIGLLFTLRGITNVSIRLPIGKIADKIGNKKPLIFSLLLLTIVFIFISFSRNIYLIALSMGLYGLAWGSRAVCGTAIISDNAPLKVRGLTMSFFYTMFDLGNTIGPILAGIITTIIPTQNIFITLMWLLPIATIITHLTIPSK